MSSGCSDETSQKVCKAAKKRQRFQREKKGAGVEKKGTVVVEKKGTVVEKKETGRGFGEARALVLRQRKPALPCGVREERHRSIDQKNPALPCGLTCDFTETSRSLPNLAAVDENSVIFGCTSFSL